MHGQESITKCDSEFTPLQCNLDQESTINSKLNQEKKKTQKTNILIKDTLINSKLNQEKNPELSIP